jgi:hypothetical protein
MPRFQAQEVGTDFSYLLQQAIANLEAETNHNL